MIKCNYSWLGKNQHGKPRIWEYATYDTLVILLKNPKLDEFGYICKTIAIWWHEPRDGWENVFDKSSGLLEISFGQIIKTRQTGTIFINLKERFTSDLIEMLKPEECKILLKYLAEREETQIRSKNGSKLY